MSEPTPSQNPAPATPRTRAINENPRLAALAAELLPTSNAFVQMSDEETRCVLAYLREVNYSRGERLFTAGDVSNSSYLLVLLEGEVSVDTGNAGGSVEISVLGPGAVLGEMAMLDGAPRSATCTAMTDIHAAGLARKGLEQMIEGHPKVAAKLMVALCQRLSDRLRALGEQLQLYAQITPR